MKYLGAKFSVAMPGGKHWPLKQYSWPTIATCPTCGHPTVPYTGIPLEDSDPPSRIAPHIRRGDENRPRKRICFGK